LTGAAGDVTMRQAHSRSACLRGTAVHRLAIASVPDVCAGRRCHRHAMAPR